MHRTRMKITLLCLATCSIVCGQELTFYSKKLRNELLGSINQNLEHQNPVISAVYANSDLQEKSFNKALSLLKTNVENTKNIQQKIGNTKTESKEAIKIVELFNNFTKSISHWQEDIKKTIKNDLEKLKTETTNAQLKDLSDRLQSISNSLKDRTTEKPGRDVSHYPDICKKGDGLQYIRIKEKSFQVFCYQKFERGGWIVIQRRLNGSTNFDLNWRDYRDGFGDLRGNFWIGLDKLNLMTSAQPHELAIMLEDFGGKKAHAKYARFIVGSESEYYSLKCLGAYTGNAGNALAYNKGMKFSTYDKDNDEAQGNCAQNKLGGWWYKSCSYSNLNGKYLGKNKFDWSALSWYNWKKTYESLKFAQMMIRPLK